MTNMGMTKRILSFLLAFCLVITSVAGVAELSGKEVSMTSEAATSAVNYQVFRQTEPVYGNYDPSGGTTSTIREKGCGIMSIVNAVYYLNGNIIPLKELFDWAYSTGGFGSSGTYRDIIYPNLQAAFGAQYGFTVGTRKYAKVTDAAFISHIQNGGVAIVHVYRHFMCIADYDPVSGRFLLIDSAPNWARESSISGNWMTADELEGGIESERFVIDWWCLLSKASSTCKNYTATATVGSGSGSVFFYNDVSTSKFAAGGTVFFRPVPASGYKVSSINLNGTSIPVTNNGNPDMYSFVMPSANATVTVNFTTGGATLPNSMLTSSATFTHPEGIVVRTDSATPNSYVGLFKSTETNYSIENSIFYYSAPSQYYDKNAEAIGTTLNMQTGFRGGKFREHGVAGTYKVLVFTASGSVVTNIVTITVSGTDAHAATITYIPEKIDYSAMDPADIVFDNSTSKYWASVGYANATTVSLSVTPKNDTALSLISAASDDPGLTLNYALLPELNTSNYKYMVVTAMTSASNKNAKMYFCPGSITGATEDCAKGWQWNNDGLWHDYIIDLSGISTFTGNLNSIRFDYFDGTTAAGSELWLRSIRFLTSKPTTPTITTGSASIAADEDITFTYSGLESYQNTNQGALFFVGLYKQGEQPGSAKSSLYTFVKNSSMTGNLTKTATGGTLLGSSIPAGNYTLWLAYDGTGSTDSTNLNNVMFATESASYDFVITEGGNQGGIEGDTTQDVIVKISTSDIEAVSGKTVASAVTELNALLGATTTITKNGESVSNTATLGTGMVATSNGKSYDIIIEGDVDGDGLVNIADAVATMIGVKDATKITGAYAKAALACNNKTKGILSILEVMAILNKI